MNVSFESFEDELADESLDRDASVVGSVGTMGTAGGKTVGTAGSVVER